MVFPPPINSKYSNASAADIDYSMTTPMAPNGQGYGTAYPCKGYATAQKVASLKPVTTLKAGQFITTQLSGTATHGGGSCQYSISTDGGATFAVIHSVIGGCPIGLTHTFQIPGNLPAAEKALFAWTWFNKIGNREMYMNCAVVSIESTTRSSSFTGPRLYRANTFGGQCVTVEGQEVMFPNPGPSVEYGGSMSAASPVTNLSPCEYDENINVTITGGGSASASPSLSTSSPASTRVSSKTSAVLSTTTSSPSSTRSSASSSISTTAKASSSTTKASSTTKTSSPTTAASQATEAFVKCNSATTFSLCSDNSTCTFMGPVAPGTICSNGKIVSAPQSSSSPAPSASYNPRTGVRCDTLTTWSLCTTPQLCTPMGNTAPGTRCVGGEMVTARKRFGIRFR